MPTAALRRIPFKRWLPPLIVCMSAAVAWPPTVPVLHLAWIGPVATALASVVHEAGHIAGGALGGLELLGFSVGPLRFERVERRWRVRLDWTTAKAHTVHAPDLRPHLRRRMFVATALGPVANLLLSVASVVLLLTHATLPHLESAFVESLAVASAVYAAVTLLPVRLLERASDGVTLLHLGSGSGSAYRFLALARVSAAQRQGVRPRDWSDEWLVPATSLRDQSGEEQAACVMAAWRALDAGEVGLARVLLDRAVQIPAWAGRPFARLAQAEAAFIAARYDRDADASRARLAAIDDLPESTVWRLRAAIALAERDLPAARRAIDAGLLALQQVEGDAGFEQDLLLAMVAEAWPEGGGPLPRDLEGRAGAMA